ncbi:MAG: TolC family protein [Bacteroidota bacterium]
MNRKSAMLLLACGLIFSVSGWGQQLIKLQDALLIASKNSPDIRTVRLSLERSQQLLNAQEASLKSNIRFTLNPIGYSHDRAFNDLYAIWNTQENLNSSGSLTVSQPIVWTDGTIAVSNRLSWQRAYSEFQDETTKSFTNNLFLEYNQPLFTYNRTKLALKTLELDYENAQLNFNLQMLNLERTVSQQFYTVYNQQMRLQIALEEYDNQKKSYEIIKNKVEGGLSALEELYQAELNLASSKSSADNYRVTLENAKDQMKILVGMDIFGDVSVLADPVVDSVPVDLDKAIQYGLDNRMELRQRQISIETAQFDMIRAKATNEFSGNLGISVGLFGDNEKFPKIYSSPTDNEDISLSLSIPIYDWGERKARIKASQASIETQEINLEDQRNTIIQNIRQVYRSLQNLLNQITIQEQSVKNAQLTYDINYERYKNGDLTGMDLNLYQNQLSSAKLDLVNAQINYKLELLNLKIQTLYDWETKSSIVPTLNK